MSSAAPFRASPQGERRRFRLGAPIVTLILVAAIVTTCTMRNLTEDPRVRSGLKVTVLDGDSFRSGTETYRLADIDAPELRQTCKDAKGATWSCGTAARDRLIALTMQGALSCTPRGHDQFGRTIARCSALKVGDIGETLVREGLALDYGRGAGTYFKAERAARDARAGMWAGDFERPQDWRRKHPRT